MTWNQLTPPIYGGALGAFGGSYLNALGAQVVPTPNVDKPVKASKPVERQNLGVLYGSGTGWTVFPGYARAPAGTWATYRAMSQHPTLALVYAVVSNPIIAGTRNVKIMGEDGTYQPRKRGPVVGDGPTESPEDKYADTLDACFRHRWSYLMNAAAESLRYGHWLLETIWSRRDGITVVDRFKSFQPGQVSVLKDKFGDFAGVKLNERELDPRYVFNVVNEPHIDPLFGVSRHENCREEWWEKIQAKIIGHKLDQKATGIIPIVKGPSGDGVDKDGNPISALDTAKKIAESLSRGEPVYMPQYLFDMDADIARANPEAAKFTAWDIDFFNAGETGTHASSILEKLNYIDKELFMAWCRPAQEAMETNFGTKAQAGSHRSVGMLDSDLVHKQIVEQINAGPVRTMNIANKGEAEADKYIFDAAPIEDTAAELRDKLITQLTSGPEAAKTVVHLDSRRMLLDAELPLVSEEEAAQKLAEAEQKAEQEKQEQMQAMQDKAEGGGAFGGLEKGLGALVGDDEPEQEAA